MVEAQATEAREYEDSLDIAVVGMAGRFPGAADVGAFWRNLCDGVCSVRFYDEDEVAAAGVAPDLYRDPRFVRAAAPLDDHDLFDAEFFGYSPHEAVVMDPAHRVLLECAWEALEAAGCVPGGEGGLVGVYAGGGAYGYLMFHVAPQAELVRTLGAKQVEIANSNDFLATRLSYKLGLEGPSVNVQSACSSSLVAVALACQELLAFQCDVALAGGVAVDVANRYGYLHHDDGLFSPDGYCRAFDAGARGTVGGSGAGLVVLKRVKDALEAGDHVHALVKGTAVNNDGARRAGFTAPRQDGQALAIATALASADVEPETVGFVEGHGTGTALGDPIEVAALRQAFEARTQRRGYCALGSVKTNIGHLDAAAGVAGFIKAVLAVEHGKVPPTLHFEEPNPRIDLAASPFFVNTELVGWPLAGGPRRAGVSSFGLGGTNAHVVLEQAPDRPPPDRAGGEQLVVLSARSAEALEAATDRLAGALRQAPGAELADVAYTLQVGRKAFDHRRVLVAGTAGDACAALEARDGEQLLSSVSEPGAERPVAFLFPGFGDQYVNMARGLDEGEPAFRAALDRCAAALDGHLERDLRTVLFDGPAAPPRAGAPAVDLRAMLEREGPAEGPLDRPLYGYPAVLAVDYALAELWRSWGVAPDAMIGHSLGEYAAACVAGVLSVEDALWLAVERARLIEDAGAGAMLAVPLGEREVRRYLDGGVDLAAVNTPRACVLSGPPEAVERVRADLEGRDVASRALGTRTAFHSRLMDPVVEPYAALVGRVPLAPPRIPFLSNVTGTWITPEQATDPRYWARHLRGTVRFSEGLAALWELPGVIMLEAGPGQSLSSMALQHPACAGVVDRVVLPSVRSRFGGQSDRAVLLRAAGQLWLAGRAPDWQGVHGGSPRRSVPLPTYPFQRRRYWLERGESPAAPAPAAPGRRQDRDTWFSVPSWQRMAQGSGRPDRLTGQRWVVFAGDGGVGDEVARQLRRAGAGVVTVSPGERWEQRGPEAFTLDPGRVGDYARLAETLRSGAGVPPRLVHCWSAGAACAGAAVGTVLDRGFWSLLRWAQACEPELMASAQRWDVVSGGACAVTGDEPLCPATATIQGICKVAPQEYPGLRCRLVDVALPAGAGSEASVRLAAAVLAELADDGDEPTVALRGPYRWRPAFEPAAVPAAGPALLRRRGVYLVTGGLGRIGLVVARCLAREAQARLVLLGRTPLPPRARWHDRGHEPATAARIGAVEELEACGAEVLLGRADVADEPALRRVVGEALQRFGRIDGLVHCAGTVGARAHRVLAEVGPEEAGAHFRAKLHGLHALDRALAGLELDFAVLCSSVASLLGGLGFGPYAAANAFMDAFAHRQRRRGLPWTSVNWEAWRFDGTGDRQGVGAAVQELALDRDEGLAVFERLVAADPGPQVVVSTADLAARARQWAHPAAPAGSAVRRHARPNLRNAYVAPNTELQRQVAAIWQELLGVEEVGIHDNFFELGGSSLLGIQVVHRLRRDLRRAVPLTIVYEGPTVATLAELLGRAPRQEDPATNARGEGGRG